MHLLNRTYNRERGESVYSTILRAVTAMAFYAEEEEVWKCPKHPSKRRRSGICPTCLRDRLVTLCPDCANVRPCACCAAVATSSSSSSSSSAGAGEVGSVSNLIDSEPALRRSRSLAIPFLRSRSRFAVDLDSGGNKPPAYGNRGKSSFWSVFRTHKNKKGEGEGREDEEAKRDEVQPQDDYSHRMMMRSRSVSVPIASDSGAGGFRSSSAKSRGWYFPSPIKAFWHSKTSKIVQERSPLYRG